MNLTETALFAWAVACVSLTANVAFIFKDLMRKYPHILTEEREK